MTEERGSAAAQEESSSPEELPREGAVDEADVARLVRDALDPVPDAPDLLRGVQQRLRARSRGKFYGDGWSVTREPRGTYLITSLLMLLLTVLVALLLLPWEVGALG